MLACLEYFDLPKPHPLTKVKLCNQLSSFRRRATPKGAVICWPAKKAGLKESGPTHKNVNKPANANPPPGQRKNRKTERHQIAQNKKESKSADWREPGKFCHRWWEMHNSRRNFPSRFCGLGFSGTMALRKLEAIQLTASRASRRSCSSRSPSRISLVSREPSSVEKVHHYHRHKCNGVKNREKLSVCAFSCKNAGYTVLAKEGFKNIKQKIK